MMNNYFKVVIVGIDNSVGDLRAKAHIGFVAAFNDRYPITILDAYKEAVEYLGNHDRQLGHAMICIWKAFPGCASALYPQLSLAGSFDRVCLEHGGYDDRGPSCHVCAAEYDWD